MESAGISLHNMRYLSLKTLNQASVCLSVCSSGLRVPIAYSLLGGGVPIPEQRIYWTLDSVLY